MVCMGRGMLATVLYTQGSEVQLALLMGGQMQSRVV